jgi:hypothetical protein
MMMDQVRLSGESRWDSQNEVRFSAEWAGFVCDFPVDNTEKAQF